MRLGYMHTNYLGIVSITLFVVKMAVELNVGVKFEIT